MMSGRLWLSKKRRAPPHCGIVPRVLERNVVERRAGVLLENGGLPHLTGPCDKDNLALGQHSVYRNLNLSRYVHGATSRA